MKLFLLRTSAMACGLFVALSASGHVLPTQNFKGKNICLAIDKPVVAGTDYDASPSPTIRMETTLGQQQATYTITVLGAGTLTISEELVLDIRICSELPLDRFAWHDDAGGREASAIFCLTAPDRWHKIHVQAFAKATGGARAALKETVAGIAACRMKSPRPYTSDDTYTSDGRLQMGP